MTEHYIEDNKVPFLVALEVEDLRVGNTVLLDGAQAPVTVELLEKLEDGTVVLRPVPLTDEVLKQWGFNELKPTIFSIITENLDWKMSLCHTGYGWMTQSALTRFSLKYLHQLQNLYFTLTGEELKKQ